MTFKPWILGAWFLVPGLAPAADLPITGQAVKELQSFDEQIKQFMDKHALPGGAAAVAKDGRLVYARGFGWADREKHLPVEPGALMRIASISKPITSAAVLRLVEQGMLKLDDPIFPFLKKFGSGEPLAADPRWEKITIERLLRHTAGFDRGVSFDPMFMPRRFELGTPLDPPAIIKFMLGRDLDFDPGTRYAYSNFGYCLLGRVIEQVTGKGYEEAVRELVLQPAGIARMRLGKTRLADRADGEVRYYVPEYFSRRRSVFPEETERVESPYGQFYLEAMDAHGGWIASAVDLARFVTALDGRRGPPLLKPESIEKLQSLSDPPVYSGKPVYYGLGWTIFPGPAGKNWSHNGSLDGTRTTLIRGHDGLVMAALFNGQPGRERAFWKEFDEILWKAASQVAAWPSTDLFPQYP